MSCAVASVLMISKMSPRQLRRLSAASKKAFGLDVNACRGLEELYTLLEDRAVIVNLLSLHLVCILFSVVLVLSTLFRFSSPWS